MVLLSSYDQYMKGIKEREKKLVWKDFVTDHVIEQVDLKLCVDTEWLQTLIALSFIPDVAQ